MEPYLIIGAGMTGLTCAAALRDAGHSPIVLEKSRGLGGRIATRTTDGLQFDHGAQFARARGAAFQHYLTQTRTDGHACDWQAEARASTIGTPKMRALVGPLATEVDIRKSTEVTGIARTSSGWQVKGTDLDMQAEHLVLAIPAPQAQRLLHKVEEDLATALDAVTVAPCWALLMAGDRMPELPDQHRYDTGPIAWICRQAARPGRSDTGDAWVVHAAPDWSRDHLEASPEQAKVMMLDHLETLLGRKALPGFVKTHRWRFALTEQALGTPYLAAPDGTLLIGGDWALGARIEAAYDSGAAMAARLIG